VARLRTPAVEFGCPADDRGGTQPTQQGLRLAIAILDSGGNVVLITRMDGCNFLSPDIARGKAFGAAAWKTPPAELNARFAGILE